MIFQQILTYGYDHNFSYFVGDEKAKEIGIIDPINPSILLPMIEEKALTVTHLIATHGHFDHCDEMKDFYDNFDKKPTLLFHKSFHFNVKIEGATYCLIDKKETFKIGQIEIEAIPTPGHEPGSVCFLVDEKLITGDTLFINGCGRADLPGSDVHQLYESLYETLWNLPDDTLIYPGHDYGPISFDRLANQKVSNPYLTCQSEKEFIKLRMGT